MMTFLKIWLILDLVAIIVFAVAICDAPIIDGAEQK